MGGEQGHRAEGLFSQVNKFRLYFKFMKKLLKGFKYERAWFALCFKTVLLVVMCDPWQGARYQVTAGAHTREMEARTRAGGAGRAPPGWLGQMRRLTQQMYRTRGSTQGGTSGDCQAPGWSNQVGLLAFAGMGRLSGHTVFQANRDNTVRWHLGQKKKNQKNLHHLLALKQN